MQRKKDKPAPRDFVVQGINTAALSPTGVRLNRPFVATTTPSKALETEEQQELFCQAVVDSEGIKSACREAGMYSSSVFYWAAQRPEFRKRLDAALAALKEEQVFALDELCNALIAMSPEEANLRANSYGKVFEYRTRLLGKLNSKYGDKPANNNINVGVQVGVVCDEEQRQKLIAMREQLILKQQGSAAARLANKEDEVPAVIEVTTEPNEHRETTPG